MKGELGEPRITGGRHYCNGGVGLRLLAGGSAAAAAAVHEK